MQNSASGAGENPSGVAPGLILKHVPGTFGICRLGSRARIPRWVHDSIFYSISRSPDELSVLCEDRLVPEEVHCERGWRAIRVVGTLDLSLIGVLASLAQPLAAARIGLFTVSTYETDYLLVRRTRLDDAVAVLEAAGHTFKDASGKADPEPEIAAPEPAEAAPAETPAAVPEPPPAADRAAGEPGERASEAPAAPDETPDEPVKPTPAPKSAFARVLAEFGLGSRKRQEPAKEPAAPAEPPPAEPVEPPAASAEVAAAVVETVEPPPIEPLPDEPPAQKDRHVQWQPEPPAVSREKRQDSDAGARAEGLFTGAIPQHPVEITDQTFEDLGLSGPILDTIREVGFEHPTPIQARVIPVAFEGYDVIGLAETGSGKTAAFCLPLAERLTHGKGTRGLILCPTREIALQTKAFLDIFGRDHELETVAVIGGVRMGPQIDGFRRDADILVATPGRLADHLRRGNVSLDLIDELVLDEADHMLDLGFLPQIKEILEQVPDERRTLMFSATMPPPIERLAQIFMRNPVRCDIRPEGQLASGIEHRLYLVKDEDLRKDCLFALLREIAGSTLIFVRRKLYTEWLARQLELAGFQVSRIHSDRTQAQRVDALRDFREGKIRILVATDVAARGIDVPLIQHVVNFGLPEQVEDYVHRAGRTARGSAAGIVSTIGTWQDKLMVRDIELDLGIEMPRCTAEGVEPYVELPKRKVVRRRRLL
jgi:ATP-dependent RNA helicase RhlE